jgi:pimeloyl-ACP methyl ester carboxylesterase
MDLHVATWGDGPPVLLVHGSVTSGEETWSAQRPLSERWKLIVVDRRGYFPNPPADGEDFEVDADDVAALLTEPTHLVGHSYGGVVALLAAARRPEMVRSLTVNEPPAFGVCPDDPAASAFVKQLEEFWAHGPDDPAEFLRAFVARVGGGVQLPDPLPPPLVQNARMLRSERSPAEAEIPLAALREAGFPKLVVSGGHSPAFDAVCHTLERELPSERAVVAGAGHSVQRTGDPYNEVLTSFLERAD